MLIQWLCSTYDEGHHLFYILSSTDMKLLAIQFCTHLLAAGVIKRIEDDSSHSDIFKVSNNNPDLQSCLNLEIFLTL